jgi:hypothetical protein
VTSTVGSVLVAMVQCPPFESVPSVVVLLGFADKEPS